MVISEAVKEAWQINTGMNKILLEYLTAEMLALRMPNND